MANIANLKSEVSASPASGLGFVGILPCSLRWKSPPGKSSKLLGYSTRSAARSSSQPYDMPANPKRCCNSGHGCCEDCGSWEQDYEHLPVPRLQHQHPPPPLYQQPQHQQQHQRTTATQQLPQIPDAYENYSNGNGLPPAESESKTYASNVAPLPRCQSHCLPACSNNSSCSGMAPAQSMIFVPFMLPVQNQPHQLPQQRQNIPPPVLAPEHCKPASLDKGIPPPPQPPPPLLPHYHPPLLQPPLPRSSPSTMLPQRLVACPLPSRAPPTPPLPPPRNVQSLKSAAAAALSVYQRVSILNYYLFVINI